MLEIRPAELPRELDSFMAVAARVYRDDPLYVAPFAAQRRRFLDPGHNPYFTKADAQAFLAWREGIPVGRIVATHDHNLGAREPGVGLFGLFESGPDRAVAQALLDAARGWLRARGLHTMRGPYDLCQNHGFGLRLPPFEGLSTYLTNHNLACYADIYEAIGLHPAMDWHGYWFEPRPPPPLMVRVEGWLRRSHAIELVPISPARAEQRDELWAVLDDALGDNWGRSAMERDEFEFWVRGLEGVLDERASFLLKIDGEWGAASLTIRDLNPLLAELGPGRPEEPAQLVELAPTPRRMRSMTVGVRRKFQALPLGVPLYLRTMSVATELGVEQLEVSRIRVDNHRMRGALERLGGTIRQTWRVYAAPTQSLART